MPSCLGTWREVQENVTEWQCVLCEVGKLHASGRQTLRDFSSEHTLDRNGPDSDLRAGEAHYASTSASRINVARNQPDGATCTQGDHPGQAVAEGDNDEVLVVVASQSRTTVVRAAMHAPQKKLLAVGQHKLLSNELDMRGRRSEAGPSVCPVRCWHPQLVEFGPLQEAGPLRNLWKQVHSRSFDPDGSRSIGSASLVACQSHFGVSLEQESPDPDLSPFMRRPSVRTTLPLLPCGLT